MKLEICVNSFKSAANAQEAGAHRVELCSELAIGGITPSFGLIKQVIKELSIPVFVLIRPRSGNFTYSDSEFEIMKQDIQFCKELGCSGIVSGVLYADNTIDKERTQKLIQLSKPLPFTFHRAFDWTPNPIKSLEQLMDLGIQRVLTSGQNSTAKEGLELLQDLKEKADNRIIILPGGGINSENAIFFKKAGFSEIHASASRTMDANNHNTYFGDIQQTVSDSETIKAILNQIKK